MSLCPLSVLRECGKPARFQGSEETVLRLSIKESARDGKRLRSLSCNAGTHLCDDDVESMAVPLSLRVERARNIHSFTGGVGFADKNGA